MSDQVRQIGMRIAAWLALTLPALSVATGKSEPNFELLVPTLLLMALPLALPGKLLPLKLILTIALTIFMLVIGSQLPSTIVVLGFILAEIAVASRSRTIAWSSGLSLLFVGAASVVVGDADSLRPLWLVQSIGIGLFVALGIAIRERRALVQETKRSLEVAENAHQVELAEAIAQERLSISRDLHNRLGHQLTVISLNTEVAKQSKNVPDQLRASLEVIGQSARHSLDEISSYLESLREKPVAADPAELLVEKFARFRKLGLEVKSQGFELPKSDEIPLLEFLDDALEELLMNALKYGNGTAKYEQSLDVGTLNITLRNDSNVKAQAPSGGGFGLRDIGDRASQLGGEFSHSLEANEFTAELKLHGWS